MCCQSSENLALGTTERGSDKGKERGDPVAHRRTSTLSSFAELDTNDNRALWKSLFRSRKDDSNTAPAKVTRDSSTEVVDVYAARIHRVGHSSSYLHLFLLHTHTSGVYRTQAETSEKVSD